MDDIKKIDPFQQMNADFDGVSINKWIELYTDYSCPKDTVFSLQKYYINNDNTLQLFVTDPNVFNDILYTKDNVLYANKLKMQLTSTFYMARHIDKQFDATSIYIASNFIKYVNEKNLGVIGNDKGDYLLYTRHDENVLYILQHNAGKFTFVKLQDMLTINDNKKSNSSTDTLQSDNMMSTQNKNTDNDIPTPNLKEIFHGEVNTASVSGEEASKPKQSKGIVSYEFTPKYTNTQIYFETTKEKDMFTAERSHVTYSVVDEIVHTEGDEYLCAHFNNGFTEIVKSFVRDKTDNEQITDAIRTYCSSDLLPETFSIGYAYIVEREVTYYKYFAPDTITTLAEQKVQYEKHKEYINSPDSKAKSREISYYIAVTYVVTSNHDVDCYIIPLNSAVLEDHIKISTIYVNSKYAECQTAYNKRRNNNIRWKLDKPTSDFEIILEDLYLRDAIINNFQRWLTNTKQDSIPKINSTSRVLNEAAFRISRFINRTKYISMRILQKLSCTLRH